MLDARYYNIKQLRAVKKEDFIAFAKRHGIDGQKVYKWLHSKESKK